MIELQAFGESGDFAGAGINKDIALWEMASIDRHAGLFDDSGGYSRARRRKLCLDKDKTHCRMQSHCHCHIRSHQFSNRHGSPSSVSGDRD
jgi:hypothetical protein